jgi:transposase
MVIHPPDVPTKDKERRRKSNKVDCRKLARGLCNGELEPIYIPSATARADRSLVRTRHAGAKQQGRLKNQITGMLNFYGIKIPERFAKSRWSGKFIRWLEGLEIENETGTEAFGYYIDELKHHRRRLCELNKRVRVLSRTDRYRERVRYLLSIPGIGIITAMVILTELVDIGRFKTLDQLASYLALIPGERSSGDWESHTGLIRRGHLYLRYLLIECAWVAVRKDPALMMAYTDLSRRMSGQKAIIRIARKLLNRVRYVLMNNDPYAMAVVE